MSLSPGQPPRSDGGQDGLPQRHSRSAAKRRWPRRHPVWSALIAIVGLLTIIVAAANAGPATATATATASKITTDAALPRHSRSAAKRRWPRRHPVWSALIAIVGLLTIVVAAAYAGPATRSKITTDAALHPAATATADRSLLKCQAQATSRQPREHTTVTIRVQTVAHAEVTVTSRLASGRKKTVAGSANAKGIWALRVRVGDATPGVRVVVTVRVSRHGSTGRCQASFRPRAAAVSGVSGVSVVAAPARG
jgi:preprotein translocase subunit SecE